MSSSSIPSALISLVGVLRAAGHEVAVFNADLFGAAYASDLDVLKGHDGYIQRLHNDSDPVWEVVRERLAAWKPDVVGVHVKTPSWAAGCRVARIAKEVSPETMTVCGGPHVSCVPEDVRPESGFDYGIAGEGEMALLRLVAASRDCERRGIGGVIRAGGNGDDWASPCEYVQKLDDLPFDGREALMDLDRYDKSGLGAVMTGRGCPFQCQYCASHKIWTRRARFRSPENVAAELQLVKDKYGVTYFEFHDDTFTVNKDRAHRICDLIRGIGDLRWKCTTRADCVDRELAENMRASGCQEVSVGVESGSERILASIQKGETKDDIRNGCEVLRAARIPFVAFIMIGFPTETEAEGWETASFAEALGADSLCGSVVTPYPGTKLYDWAQEAGRLPKKEDWSEYYHQSDGMGLWDLPPDHARSVIRAWFERVEKYNHRPSRLIKRFWSKFRSDPLGALHRSFSLIGGRLGKLAGRKKITA